MIIGVRIYHRLNVLNELDIVKTNKASLFNQDIRQYILSQY